MKNHNLLTVLTCAVFIFGTGCSSYSPEEDIYSEQSRCNGEMETSQSVTIYSTEKGAEPQQPKITQTCQPSVYDPETDFEKENRRQDL